MNLIWNNNIKAFSTRFPALSQIYSKEIEKISNQKSNQFIFENCNLEIYTAKNGQLTAKDNSISLHSSYNPEREAANALNNPEIQEKSALIFYGFGLGYHAVQAALKFPLKKLILIEPDIFRLFAALCVIDWTPVFNHKQLVLAAGCPQESILGLIEASDKVNIGNTGVSDAYIFDLPAFTAHSQSYFNDIRTIIKRNQRKNEINAATLKKFGKLWIRNSLKNLIQLKSCNPVSVFNNEKFRATFNEIPFLILGAGPSLQKVLPYLNELKKRCIIVCVETALHTLLRNNLQPDFIILSDPQFWAYRHIAGLKAPESILITEVSAYPSVFRFNCKKIMLCSSQFPIGQFAEKKLDYYLGDLGTGGSVASSAWNFAYYCGAKTIYTAGLDLGFPKKQTHIKGSSAEQSFHTFSVKTKTAENYTASVLFGANAQADVDYKGNKLITDSRMKMFAWWFEARLAACKDVKTFTLCPESLKIPGIEVSELNDLITLPVIEKKKEELLNKKCNLAFDTQKLDALINNFPKEEFLLEYDFLRPYF